MKIKPPYLVRRFALGFNDLSTSDWKLYSILNDAYFQNHLDLVEAIDIPLQCHINRRDLKWDELCVRKFCLHFSLLYGNRKENFNVHCLLHLHVTEKVKDLGPLWCHSTFFYEDLNKIFQATFSWKVACLNPDYACRLCTTGCATSS